MKITTKFFKHLTCRGGFLPRIIRAGELLYNPAVIFRADALKGLPKSFPKTNGPCEIGLQPGMSASLRYSDWPVTCIPKGYDVGERMYEMAKSMLEVPVTRFDKLVASSIEVAIEGDLNLLRYFMVLPYLGKVKFYEATNYIIAQNLNANYGFHIHKGGTPILHLCNSKWKTEMVVPVTYHSEV